MPSGSEVLGNGPIRRQKTLGMTRGFKPLHAILTLTRGTMRVLTPVIEIPTLAMLSFDQITQTHHFCRVYGPTITCSLPCNLPHYGPYSPPVRGNNWDGMPHGLEATAGIDYAVRRRGTPPAQRVPGDRKSAPPPTDDGSCTAERW